jgi:hypothetical protein
MALPMDFMLAAHLERWLDDIAPFTAGTAKAASTAMMAMTTSSSIKVKAKRESTEYRKGRRIIIS